MSAIRGFALDLLASVVLTSMALVAEEARAQISGASATATGSGCSGDDADGFCGFSAGVVTDDGSTLVTRYAWNLNADIGVGSTRDSNGSAHHNVDFTITAPGGYRLDVVTSRSGDLNRIADATGCEGQADVTGVTGLSNIVPASGSLSLADPAGMGNGSTTENDPFSQSSPTAEIFGVSNGVGQAHALDFTWTGSVRSNSCEAAVRMGEQNGSTTGCTACGYPGSPGRTQSTDGHFVTVTLVSLCGNVAIDEEVGEECDEGGANGSLSSCCSSACQVKPDSTPCDDGNVMTSGDQCIGGACQGTAGTTTSTTSSTSTTTSTTLVGPTGTPVDAVKLIVVDKATAGAKTVFVAKDPAVTKGAGTDTATIEVTFDFAYDNGTDPASAGAFVAALGSPNWAVNKGTVAKYVNKEAPTGGGTKVAVVKPGNLVKIVGKNLGDTAIDIFNQSSSPTGVANTAYCIDNDGDENCFCSTFADCSWKSIAGGAGAKVVCRAGTGDASCTALP